MSAAFPDDDVSLLTCIAQGDQLALSRLYDRYASIIYGFAFKSLNSAEECEEIVLDVFAQVWRIADRYDQQKGRVDAWLFTLVRSRILDRLRKKQRTVPVAMVSIDATEIKLQSGCLDAFEEVVIKERRDRVVCAMQTIPDEQRLVLELAYFQGLTQSEIVAKTGWALGTVKTRIRLGLNKLRSTLGSKDDW
jgi:RNA polymerase sigma-70 factor (ECF subfamily)